MRGSVVGLLVIIPVIVFAWGVDLAAAAPQPDKEKEKEKETVLIGVLTRQYTPGCVNGEDVWGEPSHLEIGFVRVLTPAHLRAGTEAMEGKVVLARGRTTNEQVPARKIFDNGGLCSVMQMRSDWVVSKGGIRRHTERRGALAKMAVFAAQSLQVIDAPAISAASKDGQVVVRFKNPVARPLSGLVLEGRYEGCFGKPGTTSRTVAVGTVARGGVAEARLERLIDDKDTGRGRTYRLDSVRVSSSGEDVVFDLDYPVGAGHKDCPGRG